MKDVVMWGIVEPPSGRVNAANVVVLGQHQPSHMVRGGA